MSVISAGTTSDSSIKFIANSDGTLTLKTNDNGSSGGTTALTLGTNQAATFASTVNATTAFSVGSAIATTGEIRLKVGQSIAYRNSVDTVNLNLVSIGSGNILTFGSTDQGHIYHNVATGQAHYKQVNGVTVTTTSSTGLAVTGTLATTDAITIATSNAVGTGGDAIVGKTSTSTNDWLLGNYGYSFASPNQLTLGSLSNIPLVLGANNAERARITPAGAFCIGTTAAAGGADVPSLTVKSATATDQCVNLWNSATSGTRWYMYFGLGSTFTATGSITSAGTTTAYNTTSDYRLKENVQPMTGALARVMALKPCTYQWKANGEAGEGFIAHELSEVCPQAVSGEKDAVRVQSVEISPAIPATYDEDGNELTPAVEAVYEDREVPSYQGVDTSFLVATLTAAIQEQQVLITTLTARIEALEAKNA